MLPLRILKPQFSQPPVAQSSILDAEETCNAFCFQKITSSSGTVPARSQDAPVASCIQNVSSNPLRLHDVVDAFFWLLASYHIYVLPPQKFKKSHTFLLSCFVLAEFSGWSYAG